MRFTCWTYISVSGFGSLLWCSTKNATFLNIPHQMNTPNREKSLTVVRWNRHQGTRVSFSVMGEERTSEKVKKKGECTSHKRPAGGSRWFRITRLRWPQSTNCAEGLRKPGLMGKIINVNLTWFSVSISSSGMNRLDFKCQQCFF